MAGININLVYTSCQQLILKELGVGYFSPDQFNSFANMAVVELFNKYADIYQDTQQVTDKILPFIKKAVLAIDDTTGRMPHESDYVDEVAVRAFNPDDLDAAIALYEKDGTAIDYNSLRQIKVKVIDNNKLGDRLNSSVLAPDRKHPIVTFYDDYVQWYPVNTGTGIFEYLRQPVEVVWAYTLDTNGLEVYDPVNSINFEFNWKMRNEIIIKICSYFGVSVRESDLVQATELMQSQQA